MSFMHKAKADFLILGANGMQGSIASRDLLEKGYNVFLTDIIRGGSEEKLAKFKNAEFQILDVSDVGAVMSTIKRCGAPIVINCAEGDWNLEVYNACLQGGAHILDLGSDVPVTKAQLGLHPFFEQAGLTAITGCGSTPGVNNVMLNYASQFFDEIHDIEAGFAWDSNIKKFVVPFSIESIIEEFTDPAPIIENHKWDERTPLDTVCEMSFRGIGGQKCFLVRHPETFTFFHYYKNKGIRNVRFYAGFPEHSFDTIKSFIDLGLGEKQKVEVEDGVAVSPVAVLGRVLRDLERPEGYKENENLWVHIHGVKDGKPKTALMECLVPTLNGWEEAGCNIDTGLTASIMAEMLARGEIKKRGSFGPEVVVPEELFFKELKKRSMIVHMDGTPVIV